jgi:hypothetical protein
MRGRHGHVIRIGKNWLGELVRIVATKISLIRRKRQEGLGLGTIQQLLQNHRIYDYISTIFLLAAPCYIRMTAVPRLERNIA